MLKFRLASGILLGVFFVASVFVLPSIWLLPVLLLLSVCGQLEFYRLMERAGMPVFKVVGVVCGAALITATFVSTGISDASLALSYKWENAVLLVCIISVFIRQFPQKNNNMPIQTIACTLFGIWYVPFLLNYFTRLAFEWSACSRSGYVGATGSIMVVYAIVVVKLADIGAYTFGRLFGRHKLFPRISPGKTWEGLLGGIACSIVASLMFSFFSAGSLGAVRLPVVHAVVLGGILAVSGTVGDLFESLLKRVSGVKDSGGAIPGMGGLLDVLDSLLFGAPVFYTYARIFLS